MADDSPNVMQAQLGLIGAPGGSFNPTGIPTPGMPAPPLVKHPGEAARDAVQEMQTQSFQNLQQSMMTRPQSMSMGGIYNPYAGGANGAALGAFAQQYQSNMASINSREISSPFYAQIMAGMTGQQAYNPHMLPSPIHMTDPSMGIFRPFAQQATASIPPAAPLPLFPTPFTPRPPIAQFATPLEYNQRLGQMRGDQYSSMALAAPGVGARFGVDVASSYVGGGLGALAGAALGGMRGAQVGSWAGTVGGLAMAEMGGLSGTAQRMVNEVNPFHALAMRSAQMSTASQGFVFSGENMGVNGRGLTPSASVMTARMVEDVAYHPQFRKETKNAFSAQDMMRMTKLAGENGMMDMSQSPEAIKTSITRIAKAMQTFMKLANEPDVREAMKQMGQLRTMGMTLPETMALAQNSRMYARMAGTTKRGIAESGGLPGAMLFQEQGLTAGLGYEMGQGAMGMARQSVASSAYTPQQLALMGGVQGLAQRNMQSSVAMLRMPMTVAAMVQTGAGGTFGLNGNNVRAMMSGQMNIGDMARVGAENVGAAVARHGVGAIGTLQSQQAELQDQLGRVLGPQGMKMLQIRQVLSTQKMLGLEGPGGFTTAATAMFGQDEAFQLTKEARTPKFFHNMVRHLDRQRADIAGQVYKEADRNKAGYLDRIGLYGSRDAIREFGAGARGGIEAFNQFFSEMGEDYGLARTGQRAVRMPSWMTATRMDEARYNALTPTDHQAYAQSLQKDVDEMSKSKALFTIDGRGYGRSETLRDYDDAYGGPVSRTKALARMRGDSSWSGGHLERMLDISTVGLYGSLTGLRSESSADKEKAIRSHRGGALARRRAMEASSSEIGDTAAKLEKKLGGNYQTFVDAFSRAVSDEAEKRKPGGVRALWASAGQLDEDDYERIKRQVEKAKGISAAGVSTDDLIEVTGRMSKGNASAGAQGAFGLKDGGIDEARSQDVIDAAIRQTDDLASGMFGTPELSGWQHAAAAGVGAVAGAVGLLAGPGAAAALGGVAFATTERWMHEGAKEEHRESLRGLFTEGNDLAGLTALRARAGRGDTAAGDKFKVLLNQVASKDKNPAARAAELTKQADAMLKRDPDRLSDWAAYGEQLSTRSVANIRAQVKADGTREILSKTPLRRNLAAELLTQGVADKSGLREMLAGGKVREFLDAASQGNIADDFEDEGLRGRVEEYRVAKAKGDTARASAIEKEVEDTVGSEMFNLSNDAISSGELTTKDREQREARVAVREAGMAAKGSFPQASETFAEGARMLLDAAIRLGRIDGGTALLSGESNPWSQ